MTALEPEVQGGLDGFVKHCREVLGEDLVAVVLYGSAAEGQLRARSDINLIVVLRKFDAKRIAGLQAAYVDARAGLRLQAMFVEAGELHEAANAFAVKFTDILSRRRVLFGEDVFAELAVSREAMQVRTKQVLLNLELRLRERFVAGGAVDMELIRVLADAAPALRASALAILHLQGQERRTPSEALWSIVRAAGRPELEKLLTTIADARQHNRVPEGAGSAVILEVLELIAFLRQRLAEAGGNGS